MTFVNGKKTVQLFMNQFLIMNKDRKPVTNKEKMLDMSDKISDIQHGGTQPLFQSIVLVHVNNRSN